METVPQPGQRFAHYRLLQKLGEGGMGVVWLAEDARLGRKAALKVLPADAVSNPVRRQRFELEARAAAALSHPGIATVYEMAEHEGQLYIAFEYVPGSTLRTRVVEGGLKSHELLPLAVDVAGALAAAHAAGIIHRDLKPENVMQTLSGACKVLDFGLARVTAADATSSTGETLPHLTTAGTIVGTVAYMAPEQLEGQSIDFRADIFALGVMLYEFATGVHPFQRPSSASTIAAILTSEPPSLTTRSRLQPPELERIVRKCLRKHREERYQSTLDLVVDLTNLKHDATGGTAAVRAVISEDDSLLRALLIRFGATPRRWWELHQLFAVFIYVPLALYLATKYCVRVSAGYGAALASNWQGLTGLTEVVSSPDAATVWRNAGLAIYVGFILFLITSAVVRLYFLILSVVVPERLTTEIRRLTPLRTSADVLVAVQFVLLGLFFVLGLSIVAGAVLAALGLAGILAAVFVEPVMVRAAFPAAFTRRPEQPERPEVGRRGWFLVHHLATMIVVSPLVVWVIVSAREYMPESLRLPLFWMTTVAIGLNWSARFAVVSTAFGDPAALRMQLRKTQRWIRWSGWPIVAGLIAMALAIAPANDGLAVVLGALAMGGIASLLFLDPAVEDAAFPDRGQRE